MPTFPVPLLDLNEFAWYWTLYLGNSFIREPIHDPHQQLSSVNCEAALETVKPKRNNTASFLINRTDRLRKCYGCRVSILKQVS